MGKRGSRKNKFQALDQWLTLHSPPPRWINLPTVLTENILQRLGPIEILLTAQSVCATWRTVCRDPFMWRVVDMRYHHRRLRLRPLLRVYSFFRRACRCAVDRSHGQLIDINIQNFGNDDLLLYVSDRSSHLKRLRIENCHIISVKGLTAAIAKLPELEELHMCFYDAMLDAEDIQTIANSCPMLKSFTNKDGLACVRWWWPKVDGRGVDDGCALAIARSMPNLRHLGLTGNRLSNVGVKAILDGCSRLESIHLRDCFHVEQDKILCNDDVRCLFDRSTLADYFD